MKPKTDGNTLDMTASAQDKTRVRVKINHPLLNKWLTAEIINNLPDATAQAVADLIEAAVRRNKPAVNAHIYSECYGGTGKTSWEALEQIKEFIANQKGMVKDVSEEQPEQPGDQ